jgi:hypothetical protein
MSSFVRFQFRRDTTANLASTVLAPGEPVYDISTGSLYVGDGTNAVGSLPTLGGGGVGATGIHEIYGNWDVGTAYVARDVVVSTQAPFDTYIAKNDVTGGSDPSLNAVDWVLLVKAGATGATGLREFFALWDGTNLSYQVGDVVVNTTVSPFDTYVCIQDIAGAPGNETPDADTSHWTLLVKAGATGGFTFSGQQYAVLWSPDGSSVTGTTGFQYNTGVGVTLDVLNIQTDDTAGRVRIGYGATTTGTDSVSIGNLTNAGSYSVSIGSFTEQSGQGLSSVAIGQETGAYTQGDSAVAIGTQAGNTGQGVSAVAIGNQAGNTGQGAYSVAVGTNAGQGLQATEGVAVGYNAGQTGQELGSVAVGSYAGQNSQQTNAIAVGSHAGQENQAQNTVALGYYAGQTGQREGSIAVGQRAGEIDQGGVDGNAVAIGNYAGNTGQGAYSVAVGTNAGQTEQGGATGYSVALGYHAGRTNQGSYSLAIGASAGVGVSHAQPAQTIILNASGVETNGVDGQTGSFYVNPVRTIAVDATSEIATLLVTGNTYYQVFYSPATYEFIYVTQSV